MDLLSLADRLWTGDARIEDHSPFSIDSRLVEVQPGTAFVASFGNVSAFDTSEGLVLVDTGIAFAAPTIVEKLRGWSNKRIHSVVYSHGHVDHVTGMRFIKNEADTRSDPNPRVIAHEAVAERLRRYLKTAGYNSVINARQFQVEVPWPVDYEFPDETFSDSLNLQVGGTPIELRHGRGETDDHTWTWLPDRKVLATGDFFIWVSPNAGNPQKVQRYPDEWAVQLRKMASCNAEVLLPGHGLPIVGADRVRQALEDSASLLESVVEQTLAMMNEGANIYDIIYSVVIPRELAEKPYLHAVYDEPEFIIRNVWRLYGGWFDGIPANLKPSRPLELASEIADLAGGPQRLMDRAEELVGRGNFRIACELADYAGLVTDDVDLHRRRAEIYEARAANEASLMAKGIFSWAARESRKRI